MNQTPPSPCTLPQEAHNLMVVVGGTAMQTEQPCDECYDRGQPQRGLGEACRLEELTSREKVSQGGLPGGGSTLQSLKGGRVK